MADRSAGLVMRHRLAWLAAAGLAGIFTSPWITAANGRLVTVARALMPWAGLTGAPLAVLAARHSRRGVAISGAVIAAATAAVCVPLLRRRPGPQADADATALSIMHANLLWTNHRARDVGPALRPLGVDVITFSEYTPRHARALHASALAEEYPHKIEIPAHRGSGIAMWSRYPLTPRATVRTKHHTVVADVHAPGRSLRVIVIHTQSPTVHHGDWLADLETLATITVDGPTVMTGDFNASWWHPEFRAVLGNTWRDAHVAVGRGLSCSWPTDQWHAIFRWHPPFVRLDHALVSDEVALLDVMDLDVPGSDHLGLVVTVAPAAGAMT